MQTTDKPAGAKSADAKPWLLPLVSVAIGVVYLVAGIAAGETGFGIFGLALMTAVGIGLLLVRRRSETVAGLMSRKDERINSLDLKATAFSGTVMAGGVLVAFVVTLVRGGDPMPYAAIGALGGVGYLAALVWFRVRG